MFRITVEGLHQNITRFERLRRDIEDVDLSPAVRRMARVWNRHFLGEGRGTWAQLGPATQRVRASRGYNPQHPILRQSGDLYEAAVEGPLYTTRSGATVLGDKVQSITSINKGNASVRIQGEKVKNHYGGETGYSDDDESLFRPGPGSWSLPARPFWFIDNEVEQQVVEGVQEEVDKVVRRYQ